MTDIDAVIEFNGIVYDIEIRKGILGKNEDAIDGIDYCKGWHDHENMGISCLCAYDYPTGRYRVFMEDNLSEFVELTMERDFLVGFNSVRFDNKVLAFGQGDTACDFNLGILNYDILAEMWMAAGLNPDKFQWQTHGGYGLDDTGRINLGHQKTGHGALAPIQWQRGEIGAVIDYCLEDVRLTKNLMDLVLMNGSLLSPKRPDYVLKMRRPDKEVFQAEYEERFR